MLYVISFAHILFDLINWCSSVAALRSNAGLISLFFFLTMTFLFLTIAQFVDNVKIQKAGGGFGIITAFIAYYCGAANMLSRESSFFMLPLVPIPPPKSD